MATYYDKRGFNNSSRCKLYKSEHGLDMPFVKGFILYSVDSDCKCKLGVVGIHLSGVSYMHMD